LKLVSSVSLLSLREKGRFINGEGEEEVTLKTQRADGEGVGANCNEGAMSSVVDLHRYDADPGPNPDPTFNFDPTVSESSGFRTLAMSVAVFLYSTGTYFTDDVY
jgi:hypothetical protein